MSGLFNYISEKTIDINCRKAACIFLTRYLEDYWFNDTEKALSNPNKILKEETKNYFKSNILQLLLSVETNLLPLIKQMIIIIIKKAGGYNTIWPELMSYLSNILNQKNYSNSSEIYHLISKIIQRYHIERKSYELFDEIKKTLNTICPILTEDAIKMINFLLSNPNDKNGIEQSIKMLKRILDIFYSLNYQDFPEFFEDHLKEWIEILQGSLKFKINSNELYDQMIKLKGKTMKCVNLYFSNYYDDMKPEGLDYTQNFYNLVWDLISIIKQVDEYSKLTRELLEFYRINFQYRHIGNLNENQINELIKNLIIPNVKMTEKEQDEFNDNPVGFLKVELEETDMDSNKYYAINLTRQLIDLYPQFTVNSITEMIKKFLNDYYSNIQNWNLKIMAINLIFAIQIKTFAQRIGVTEMSKYALDMNSLINEVFTKEFNTPNTLIVSKVYCLKFLTTFRLQIPIQFLSNVIQMLIDILNGSDNICQNACLLSLEKILFMNDLKTREPLSKNAINEQNLFNNLISALMNFISNSTNIFAMRCFFRTLSLTNDNLYISIYKDLSNTLDQILKNIIKNPEQDEFNFYFFQTCALLIKKTALQGNNCEIPKYFLSIIQNDLNIILNDAITDLMGYVFQLFAYYIHVSKDNSEFYSNLLKQILYNQNSWSLNFKYLFNPYISYIKVNFISNKEFFNNNNSVDQIFAICGILLNYKCYKQLFELLDYLINFLEPNNFLNSLFNVIGATYNLLQENKKENPKGFKELGQEFMVFLSKLSLRIDFSNIVSIINKIGGVNFLNEMIDMFSYLGDNQKVKKILLYFYCKYITDFCNEMNDEILIELTKKLLEVVQKFYKIDFSIFYSNSKPEDNSYAAHNYNKLTVANIIIEFNNYKNISDMEEGQMFFNAQKTIFKKKNKNYVKEAISKMKGREAEIFKSVCSKYNFPYN